MKNQKNNNESLNKTNLDAQNKKSGCATNCSNCSDKHQATDCKSNEHKSDKCCKD